MRFNQQSWKLYREVIYVDPFKKIYIFFAVNYFVKYFSNKSVAF